MVVGSKNFTESILLGEIVAQQLETHGFTVDRRFNLGGTFICHNAMVAGQMDVYVEYTGTAYSAILELPTERDPVIVRAVIDSVYRDRWDMVWGEPLGFNNTFALLVRADDAEAHGLTTLSDAVPYSNQWRFGAGYEFIERADGYRGLLEFYNLEFAGQPLEMELGITYRALADGRVDIIAGNSTDGQIEALDLYHLADDRRYFPPYEAVPLVRGEVLRQHPEIGTALRTLGATLTDGEMRRLNYLVDVEKQSVSEVARQFLDEVEDGERN
ncbi:MAG: ABC transporter substrate-binding protein [Gemmatimonadota bacterium]|nr:MAG: ABC transporter substrate-binding protein [Gemmatimonadota bacterium]